MNYETENVAKNLDGDILPAHTDFDIYKESFTNKTENIYKSLDVLSQKLERFSVRQNNSTNDQKDVAKDCTEFEEMTARHINILNSINDVIINITDNFRL